MTQSTQPKKKNPRTILLWVWGGFFVLNLALLFFYYFSGEMEADNLKAGLKMLNAVYAPYLGVMFLFVWGSGRAKPVRRGLPFILALVAAVIWNGVIFVFLLLLSIEKAVSGITDFAALFSWLTAGAIGYYFAKRGE